MSHQIDVKESLAPGHKGESCEQNVNSPYLRCAINPKGNCNNCSDFKEDLANPIPKNAFDIGETFFCLGCSLDRPTFPGWFSSPICEECWQEVSEINMREQMKDWSY